MDNFVHDIDTKVYFGENQLDNLGSELASFGSKVLLVYGGGSIKRNGVYNKIVECCKTNNLELHELANVDPNPRVESVRAGVEICRNHNIDVILAAGGGSVIDCSKGIAAATFCDVDAWEMVLNPSVIKCALPIVSIITLAATGSEMNTGAVISNWETNDKIGFGSPYTRPKVTFEDPTLTYSVSQYQTSAGTADIISHLLEQYFNPNRVYMANRMAEALLKTCIHYGPIALQNPNNYEARANLLWTSSWALNGFIRESSNIGWTVHPIEHQLSAYYDVTHGMGLAVLTPHWMRHVCREETVDVFVEYGVNVWDINPNQDKLEIANQAIEATSNFFKKLNIPSTLKEIGVIDKSNFDVMAQKASNSLKNVFFPLTKEDIIEIFEKCYE